MSINSISQIDRQKPGVGGIDMTSLNEVLQNITKQRGLDNPRFVVNSAGQLVPNSKLQQTSTAKDSQKEMVQQMRVETMAPQVPATESQSGSGKSSGGQSDNTPQSVTPSFSVVPISPIPFTTQWKG